MREFILDFPNQFKKGIKAAEAVNVNFYDKKFSNLVVCGMGGSALPGDIIKALPHFNLPVIVHRSYGFPREANQNSLIFISSYSGNTEETIDAFHETLKQNFNIVGFSKGGELEKLCKENNISHIKYLQENENFQPRFALGETFSAMMFTLSRFELLPHNPKSKLEELAEILNDKNNFLEEQGKEIAEKIFGKIILVYAPYELRSLSYVWKINFNETSKIPAFANSFPELNHNEMNGFVNSVKILEDKMIILNLQDKDMFDKMNKRAKITSLLLLNYGIKTIDIEISGVNILDKIFSSTILSMWTSYYLALLYKTDPISVKIAEDFKMKLKNN